MVYLWASFRSQNKQKLFINIVQGFLFLTKMGRVFFDVETIFFKKV